MLACADKVQVLALDLIHHCVHIRLAHNALNNIAVDHERGNAVGKALSYHKVAGICQNRGVKSCNIAHEVVEAVA